MFWGLILEAGKRYSQEVVKSFHVSMASLEINSNTDDENGAVPVMLEYGDGREFLLCNLHKDRNMQCKLDLSFKAGEHIGFYSASGKNRVHLTGYLEEELYDLSDEGEEEEEEEEDEVEKTSILSKATKRKLSSKVSDVKKQKLALTDESDSEEEDCDFEIEEKEESEGEEEESEEADEGEEEEEEEEDSDNLTTQVKKKGNESVQKKQDSNIKVDKSKQKEGNESKQQKLNESLKTRKAENIKTSNGKQKKKENLKRAEKTPIHEQNGKVKTAQSKKSHEANEPSRRTLSGGVIIEDKIVGKGAVADAGNKVTVYYVGRLKKNNKQFDSTTSGAGFKFVLGHGEVIKGWDIGLSGMKVGGKRIITIPSYLAYGSRGQPPVIPCNSDLIFEVELRGVSK